MLKYLHCRQTLILICSLVVLECMCVMAELMVDLQGIRVRFDNEEEEVKNFLDFVKSENVTGLSNFKGKSLTDVLKLVQNHLIYIDEEHKKYHGCLCDTDIGKGDEPTTITEEAASRRKRSDRAENSASIFTIADTKQYRLKSVNKETRQSDKHKHLRNVIRNSSSVISEYKDENKGQRLNKKDYKNRTIAPQTEIKYKDGDQEPNINTTASEKVRTYFQNIPVKLLHTLPKNLAIDLRMGSTFANASSLINRLVYSNKLRNLIKAGQKTHTVQKHPETINARTYTHEHVRVKRDVNDVITCDHVTDSSVFIFAVNIRDSGLYIVSHLANLSSTVVDETMLERSSHYQEQSEAIQAISHTIKYVGFCILTIMLCETLIKIACLGTTFLKKKIEVFDALIVVASFALDVVFIDSKWYESGKDATTILVLLLPWRVVRIVNSFMMTLNHKHKIEMMIVKRAKKRTENKLRKLEHLSVEIRRDVELLINLCKLKGASETEIDACIYSKGRGPTTLSAITSFASLMFISTLGKDPSQKDDFKDIYGELVREVLEDEDEDSDSEKIDGDITSDKDTYGDLVREVLEEEDEDSDTEKFDGDLTRYKEMGDAEPKNLYYVSRSYSARAKTASKKAEHKHSGRSKPRRATLPRRHGSCDDGDNNVYYINDGFESTTEETNGKMRLYTKRGSKSLPSISHSQAKNRSNVVTFEVTTQVTYL